jgi:sugar O-acyltransferase (sialic acid O-acetyltransferase NeuD family)
MILKKFIIKKLAIIGAGGHGKVVGEIALLNNYQSINFFDDKFNRIKEFPFNILGNLKYLKDHLKDYDFFFVAIGDNHLRHDKIEWLKKEKVNIISLVHPKSVISKLSSLDIGTCVMANAVVNAGSLIKEGVIINTSASIDHDCIIEEYAHISPNCSLSGSIKIGKFSHLGTGTSVQPGISVGNNVKTGIGSKIYKDILDNKIYKE